jgi:nucleotide-binding universal stress UspA family protein
MTRTSGIAFKSILCPVDFSTHSRDALRHAVATARRFSGRVTVMFVSDPLLLAAASGSARGRRQFIERTRVELAQFVAHWTGDPSHGRDEIATVVATGNPADEILRTARRLRSDLIVIGTEGLSGIRKLFFGSTTEQVLRRVPISVLAIPPSKRTRLVTSRPMAIGRVVAPLDLAGEWQTDAIRAAGVAAAFDADLLLVHVLAPIQTPPWLRSTAGATDRRRMDTARRTLERVKAKLSSNVATSTRVLEGNPASEIARLSTRPASLVVMSLRGGAGVLGARRGSIAYHVLTQASTPVLALPRRRLGGRLSTRLAKAVTGALTERDRIEMAGIDALLSAASTRRRGRR